MATMLAASDPTLSAAEALVSFHAAPVINNQTALGSSSFIPKESSSSAPSDQQDHRAAAPPQVQPPQAPAPPQQTPRTRPGRKISQANTTDLDWHSESDQRQASAREERDEAKLGLGLGPVDDLTEDIRGRFHALRSDIMAVDGSMDLEAYQLSTYDLQQLLEMQRKAEEEKAAGKKPSLTLSGIKKHLAKFPKRKCYGVKLQPISEEAVAEAMERAKTRKSQRGLRESAKIPLPSIRSILNGGPSSSRDAGVAPAEGPVMESDVAGPTPMESIDEDGNFTVYRGTDGMISDDETISDYSTPSHSQVTSPARIPRPYLPPPPGARARIVSEAMGSTRRPSGVPGLAPVLIRGSMIRTAPGMGVESIHHRLLPVSARYLRSAPSGTTEDSSIMDGGDVDPLPPAKRVMVHGPRPVEDIVHRQQHHIQELAQQNLWLQQQLAQVQAQGSSGGGSVRAGGSGSMIPVSSLSSMGRRRPCTPCPHQHHHHIHTHPGQSFHPPAPIYRHAQPHGHPVAPSLGIPPEPHKRKPYSVIGDGMPTRPRYPVAAGSASGYLMPPSSSGPVVSSIHDPMEVTSPTSSSYRQHLLPSPVSSATPASPTDDIVEENKTADVKSGEGVTEHQQTLAKLGEYLCSKRGRSASGGGEGGGGGDSGRDEENDVVPMDE